MNADDRPDARDFEAFFEAHSGQLFGTLCLATGDTVEAEDLMQEAFLKLWERWESLGGHPDVAGYLYKTAFNLNRNRLRRAARSARRLVTPSRSEDEVARVEEREVLLKGLRGLSPRQREAVVLVGLMSMTSEEAAEMIGVRSSTVRVLVSRARAALRAALEEADG